MTNRFYERDFNANRGTQARSRPVRNEFAQIETACELIQAELDALNGRYMPVVTVSATDYVLPVFTARTRFEFTASSAVTARVSPEVFPNGSNCLLIQRGAGSVTVIAEAGVTLITVDGNASTGKQNAILELIALADDTFLLRPVRDSARLSGGNAFTGAQTVAFAVLTDAETIATDAALSNHFSVTLGGNRTLANPTNMRDGGIYNWRIKQDGSGSRTLTYGSKFKWPGGTAPALTTTAGAVDRIVGQYIAADDVIECAMTKDFR